VDVVDIAEAIFLERPAEAVCVFGVKEAGKRNPSPPEMA
jgi:hypothetical protein